MKNDLTIKQLENYYRKEPAETNRAILAFLRDTHPETVVYGTRAINTQLPKWLQRETDDWDIMTIKDNAEGLAKRLEQLLDKRYGGDYFVVTPAKHEGTFKIRSRVTGQGVADITLKDREVQLKVIKGISYSTLDFQEAEARKILDDPEFAFRHKKDQDTIQRITIAKQEKKRRKRRSNNSNPYWDPGMAGTLM